MTRTLGYECGSCGARTEFIACDACQSSYTHVLADDGEEWPCPGCGVRVPLDAAVHEFSSAPSIAPEDLLPVGTAPALEEDGWPAFIGQTVLKHKLLQRMRLALAQTRPLEHVLLSGPAGMGKSTITRAIAPYMACPVTVLTMPMERPALVRGIQMPSFRGGILFLEEIDALSKRNQEFLLPVLQESVVIDARGRRWKIPWLTVVATTTQPGKVITRLHDSFPITLTLEDYTDEEFASLIVQNLKRNQAKDTEVWELSDAQASDVIDELVRRCEPTPRIAEQLADAAGKLWSLSRTVNADAIIDWCGARCERRPAGDPSLGSPNRPFIRDDVKLFVWRRDEGACTRCGSNKELEYDHIIPLAMGGSNTARNLQLLCASCNRQKGPRLV